MGYEDFGELARRLERHAMNREREQLQPILRELQDMAHRISVAEQGESTSIQRTA
jgi:hypothetical protein